MQESDIFQSPREKSPRLTRNSSGVDYVGIMQDAIKADDKPSRLGNLYCFMYRNGQPMIVFGPDWHFSLLKLALTNFVSLMVLIGTFKY